MKITIDTCLINVKKRLPEMNMLENFNAKGLIEIVGTDRLLQETQENQARSSKARSIKNISEPFTVGKSRIGHSYIAKEKGPSFKQIASILFPNRPDLNENESNDIMHLISHAHSDSEYFVTNNKWDFIHSKRTNQNRDGSYKDFKKSQLKDLGIMVVLPNEMIEILDVLLT